MAGYLLRGLMIRVFDFRHPSISRASPRSPIGSGFKHIRQFWRFNGSEKEKLSKVSKAKGICPPGCPLEV